MLLYYFVTAIHVLVCFVLILVVLLQSGKGADLSGAFGGGGTQTAFGSRGPASFLSKATTFAAIIFMVTSILLSGLSTRGGVTKSIMDSTKQGSLPAPAAPAKPATTSGSAKMLTPEQIKKQQEEIEAKQKQTPAPPAEKAAAPVAVPAGKDAPPPVKKDASGK